jgi:hypothetical protein
MVSPGCGLTAATDAPRDVFGLRCSWGEPDYLVPDRETIDTGTDLGDVSREVVALPLGEVGRPRGREAALANTDFTGVGGRGHHGRHHLPGTGGRAGDLDDVEDVRAAIAGEPHRPHHNWANPPPT